ncbi:MAG: TrbC/VirB2 family protein [Deltaproteobacteria bacterium]|jgi:type IV secretory pathway VirB2 component (pilin)|nr:TrbC/VirB2 family protein [Deltaproteobacteria bacterium]
MLYEGKTAARLIVPALVCVFIVLLPDLALADEVSTAFQRPIKMVLDLLTGTIAGLLVALSVVVAGIAYIIGKDDVSGWVMVLVRIAIGGVIMFAAGKIANWWFY